MHLFTVLEFACVIMIFRHEINSGIFSSLYKWCAVIFAPAFVANTIFFGGLWHINYLSSTIEALLLLIICFFYFRHLLNSLNIPSLPDSYFFWLSSAFFFYFTSVLILFLFSQYILSESKKSIRYLWVLYSIINTVYHLIITLAVTKWKKT
jgi:Co/Zn/Cd efflux system component